MTTQDKAQHQSIAQALAAAQMNMGKAVKASANPHFRSKYADLGAVMDACLPALNAEGIAVIHTMHEDELGRSVVTRFLHASGETLDCAVPLIIGKQDMQGLGSAMTYARRYGLMALAGIAPEDDDGNAAVASVKAAPQARTWAQTVTDELPPEATSAQKMRAVADALIAQWKRKRTPGELNNEWDRRDADKTLPTLEKHAPEMFTEVQDAFSVRMNDLVDAKRETAGMPT